MPRDEFAGPVDAGFAGALGDGGEPLGQVAFAPPGFDHYRIKEDVPVGISKGREVQGDAAGNDVARASSASAW
ncbi:hypothetical protein AHiyo4_30320 [Arthrobacter sp. Hiyo4]|nr:hypothetical protein AHiyo4_30320 [Arthrobacter sp. Hiyo4]